MKTDLETLIKYARETNTIVRVTIYPTFDAVPNVSALTDAENLIEVDPCPESERKS